MICKFCHVALVENEKEAPWTDNGIFVYRQGRWSHVVGPAWICVSPVEGAPDPKCHTCGTITAEHGINCSASGRPPYHAEP